MGKKPFMQIVEEVEQEVRVEKATNTEFSSKDGHEISLDGPMREALDKGGDAMAFSVPKYTTAKRGQLSVSHAVIDGEDYYYQIELARKAAMDDRTIIGMLVQAFSTVVPDHIDVYIREPPQELDWPIWTVVVKNGATLMGAKQFMEEKLVNKLLELDFWP